MYRPLDYPRMSATLDCASCGSEIGLGEARRPSDVGTVHEDCKPVVHTPRDTSGLERWALVFAADSMRVFKRPASPFRDGPLARESE
jgi:hypothetical protein